MSGLTNKQAAFVEEYLVDFNATRAAERAGYGGDDATLAAIGCENLKKPKIAERIKQRLAEAAMTADEVLGRLASIARAEYARYITADGAVNLELMVADNKAHLIKCIRETKYGKVVEFYDSQKALVDIGRHHALFVDRLDATSKGDKLPAPVICLPPVEGEEEDSGGE